MSKNFDDEFAAEARRAEEEEKAREESKKKGGWGNFPDIKWTGFIESPQTKVLRFLGKHPDLHYGTTIPPSEGGDAHVINLSRLIADNGKQMDLVLPLYDRDSNHIMWRIIDRVNSVEWRKSKDPKDPSKTITTKAYVNQEKYPDIFGIVGWSGLPADNKQRKFGLVGHGWRGREVLIANVLDREIMEWHKSFKHSALLAKKITYKDNPDGTSTEFIDKGIPAWGLGELLNNLRKTYGDWEKYDIGFTRKGTKENPNALFNATRTPEQVPEALQDVVGEFGDLSDEERSWEKYDISKIFRVTPYTKIYNRLRLTIERIDACFGTFYADELRKLMETEQESATSFNPKEYEDPTPDSLPEEKEESVEEPLEEPLVEKKVTRSLAPDSAPAGSPSDLPGWSKLSIREKASIVSVVAPVGKSTEWKITYNDKASKRLGECPDCSTKSPEDFFKCPGCGAAFS